MESPSESEKGKKVSKGNRHFEIYLEYVKVHSVLKLKWTVQRSYTSQIQNIWENMTKELNGCGGPVRDVTHWKKVFTEWKSHIRRKLKYNKPLNDAEKQLVEITGLTSIPERRVKCTKVVNEKTILIDSNNEKDHTKENVLTIKEEIEDSMEGSTINNIVEPEPVPCKVDSSKKKRKIIIEEIPRRTNSAQKEQNPYPANTQKIRPHQHQPLNSVSKGAYQSKSSERSTQVDQVMLGEPSATDLASIGAALQSLSNAVNRYCDLIERRLF